MDTLDAAVKLLTTAASSSRVKDKKLLVEMAGHASTHLVLLKLSSISEQVAEKLCNFFRTSFFTLYTGLTVPTLRLVSAIFETVYHEHVLSAMGSGKEEQKSRWEAVLHALLGGVLDFLDNNHTTETKDAIGDTLFSTLGDICFSLSAPRTSVDLRCTGYNILIDSAASHQENQEKMRDPNILGGERLGSCIWRTKDYLALEGLLNLFARILPSTNGSTSGRARRTAFVQSVFLRSAPPEFATTGKDIVDLLECVLSSDWDETSMKIVDIMARASIIYPQSFGINEVVVSGTTYPSDRLYADDKTFLVNVVLEREDQYESLEVSYTAISKVRLSRSSAGRTHVILSLNSPPRLGKSFLQISVGAVVGFSLGVEDEGRLLQALRSRGLAQMVTEEPPLIQKLSVATEPAKLEVDSKGKLVKEPNQNERIENLSQFYRTDEKSDDVLSAGDLEAFCPIETTSPSVGPSKAIASCPGRGEEGVKHNHSEPSVSSTKVPSGSSAPNLASPDSKFLFDAAFGTSDDELSEFTDEETPLPRTKTLRRTSTSISIQGRISFEPASSKAVLPPARLARGGVGKVVLDSDDEAPPAVALRQSRKAKKTLIRAPTTDTAATEDRAAPSPDPEATTTSDVFTPGSEAKAKILVPATTSGQRSTTSKVLRFSDVHIPVPDFNAALSSPPTVPTSVLKSALVKRPPKLQSSTLQCTCPSAAATVAKPLFTEKAAAKAKDVLDDLIPASSSPTPCTKKPVKASLHKKGQTTVDPPPVQHVKRKAAAMDSDNNDDVPLVSHEKPAARPAKRTRSSPASPKATPAPRPKVSSPKKPSDLESPALRPPMQPRRRYHARKGRTSSPRAATAGDDPELAPGPAAVSKGDFADVDYDELPTIPPRPSAVAGTVKMSSSPAAKPKQEPVKTAAKAKEAFEGEKVEKVEKVGKPRKKAGDKKTEKAGNAVKPTTAEKPAQVDVAKTSPENVKPPMTRAGSTAQKDNVTSKASAATKTGAHEPVNSANANESVEANDSHGGVTAKAASRVLRSRPRPRRAAASATKAKEEDTVRPAIANASEPELAVVSPVLERTSVRTDEGNTSAVAAEAFDAADIAIAVANDATSSDLELTFLEDVEPPQPEIVFSDPSTVNNFTEDAGSSLSKSAPSKPKTVKARSATTPWDAMVERTQQPQQPPPDPPSRAEPVMVLAEDRVQAPALDATVLGNASTDTCTVDTKDAPATLVRTRAETRETAVQTTSTTVSPTSQVESKPVVIDLTLDSPPKPIRKSQPKIAPVAPSDDDVDTAGLVVPEDARGRRNYAQPAKEHLPQPIPHPHIVRFTSPTEKPSMHARYGKGRSRDQLRSHQLDAFREGGNNAEFAEAGDETLVDIDCGSGDPGLDAIVDVLNKLHQVVVGSIAKKFEGVREEVRAGRDELLRYAAADLHTLHAQSVMHFNRLVDLEAEYATVGRNVLHANEDWVNVNQQACDALAVVVEKHDRGTLSKQMPATLITLSL